MFWRNLNVFITSLVMISLFAGPFVGFMLRLFAAPLVGTLFTPQYGSYLVVAAVLIIIWIRRGLAPAEIRPEREGRHRIGMRLLTAANVVFVLTLFVVGLFAAMGMAEYHGMVAFVYLWPAMALAILVGPIGLLMVLTSGA